MPVSYKCHLLVWEPFKPWWGCQCDWLKTPSHGTWEDIVGSTFSNSVYFPKDALQKQIERDDSAGGRGTRKRGHNGAKWGGTDTNR